MVTTLRHAFCTECYLWPDWLRCWGEWQPSWWPLLCFLHRMLSVTFWLAEMLRWLAAIIVTTFVVFAQNKLSVTFWLAKVLRWLAAIMVTTFVWFLHRMLSVTFWLAEVLGWLAVQPSTITENMTSPSPTLLASVPDTAMMRRIPLEMASSDTM